MALDLDKIAEEISTLFVAITEKDANDYKKLQIKLIICNANQDQVVKRLTEIEPLVAKKENEINNKKFALNARKQDIKTNTEKVKKLPTGKERDEAAEELLHNDYKELLNLENNLNNLKVVRNSLITTLRKLKTTEQNIKLLKSMLDEQVSKLNVGSIGDPDVAHLQKSLSELDDIEEQLDDELGLEDDVENGEEYIEDSEGATHDESEQPSNAPLDSQDSHDASEELLMCLDGLDDESAGPSNKPLDPTDSPSDPKKSSNEDMISNFINDEIDLNPTEEGPSDINFKDDKEVTAKQPTPEDSKDKPESEKSKRDLMKEISGEDFLDDDQVVSEDGDVDMSSFMDDFDTEDPVEDIVGSIVEKDIPVEESKVVEDEASIGEEYDIESLLDM